MTAFYWFDQDHTCGLDANAFWMGEAMKQAEYFGGGDVNGPVLARPFVNPNAGAQDADPIVVPGVQAGGLLITLSRSFYGGDANCALQRVHRHHALRAVLVPRRRALPVPQ